MVSHLALSHTKIIAKSLIVQNKLEEALLIMRILLRSACESTSKDAAASEVFELLLLMQRWSDAREIACGLCISAWDLDLKFADAHLQAGNLDLAEAILADEKFDKPLTPKHGFLLQKLLQSKLNPSWIGFGRLASRRSIYTQRKPAFKLRYVAPVGTTGRARVRKIELPRTPWPCNTGAVLYNARVAPFDWGVYCAEAGGLQYTTFHDNKRFKIGGGTPERQQITINRPSKIISGTTILLGGFVNYYHTLVDYYINYYYVLGIIICRTGDDSNFNVLVANDPRKFHGEILDYLSVPIKARVSVDYDDTVLCEKLVLLPRAVVGFGVVRDRRPLQWLRTLATQRRAGHAKARRIIVSRQRATSRRLTNEDDVMFLLSALGFTKVCLEDFQFSAQVELFSHADFVIGVHGAGLANIIVGQDLKVVEIIPVDGIVQNFFANICEGCGHTYFRYPVAGKYEDNVDVTVDPVHFFQFVATRL